ncbi:hypothetical protein D3C84_715850 [compost metagenome]
MMDNHLGSNTGFQWRIVIRVLNHYIGRTGHTAEFSFQILQVWKLCGCFALCETNGGCGVIGERCQALFFVGLGSSFYARGDEFELCCVVTVVKMKHPFPVFAVIFAGWVVHESEV